MCDMTCKYEMAKVICKGFITFQILILDIDSIDRQ